jgi:hypothetical protein
VAADGREIRRLVDPYGNSVKVVDAAPRSVSTAAVAGKLTRPNCCATTEGAVTALAISRGWCRQGSWSFRQGRAFRLTRGTQGRLHTPAEDREFIRREVVRIGQGDLVRVDNQALSERPRRCFPRVAEWSCGLFGSDSSPNNAIRVR